MINPKGVNLIYRFFPTNFYKWSEGTVTEIEITIGTEIEIVITDLIETEIAEEKDLDLDEDPLPDHAMIESVTATVEEVVQTLPADIDGLHINQGPKKTTEEATERSQNDKIPSKNLLHHLRVSR